MYSFCCFWYEIIYVVKKRSCSLLALASRKYWNLLNFQIRQLSPKHLWCFSVFDGISFILLTEPKKTTTYKSYTNPESILLTKKHFWWFPPIPQLLNTLLQNTTHSLQFSLGKIIFSLFHFQKSFVRVWVFLFIWRSRGSRPNPNLKRGTYSRCLIQ